jgi:hypothetical protein
MPNKGKYDKDTRAKAIRLVREHAGDYPTEWAAITAVSGRPPPEGGQSGHPNALIESVSAGASILNQAASTIVIGNGAITVGGTAITVRRRRSFAVVF